MAGFFRSLGRHHFRLHSGRRTVAHHSGPEASGVPAAGAFFPAGPVSASAYLPRSRRCKLTIASTALAAGLLFQANAQPVSASESWRFVQVATGHPFETLNVGNATKPALVDIDHDGDLDLFVGNIDGGIRYFRNNGTNTNPAFEQVSGAGNPLDLVSVGSYSAPALVDIDHDGDLDAFVGGTLGTISYFKNNGNDSNPVFAQVSGVGNPLNLVAVGSYSAPALADIDHDGDPDAFVGSVTGAIDFFRNTGNDSHPVFTQMFGAANPLDAVAGLELGRMAPVLVDIDQDGDLDAFTGGDESLGFPTYSTSGMINYFKNTGNDSNPVFSRQTGAANPFDGVNVGLEPALAFGELNGDGRFEVVVGRSAVPLAYFVKLDPLQPPAATTDPGSAMYTLEDVYRRLRYGDAGVKRPGAFVGPGSGPQPSGFTLDETMKRAPQPLPANDSTCARPADVLQGYWFWSTCVDTWGLRQGTKLGP